MVFTQATDGGRPGPSSTVGRRRVLAVAGGVALSGVLAACTPSPGGSNTSVSGQAGDVTPRIDPDQQIDLTVWARINPGTSPGLQQLTESFQKKYPNVHVTIVNRASANYMTQVKTALLGSDPPDVVQGAQGFAGDSQLIKAKVIQPLDRYAKALGWLSRYSADTRRQFQMGSDGNTFGSGPLWGVAEATSLIGWYYNKKLLSAIGGSIPATLPEFEALLAQSKAAGQTPIMAGNLEGTAGGFLFMAIHNQLVSVQDGIGIAYTDTAATWNTPAFVASAQKLRDWVNSGYLESGYDGMSYNDQDANFAKGNALFMIGGLSEGGTLQAGMGSDVGYFAPPPAKAGDPYRMTGSMLNPWHVSAATKNPDAAVLYLDWITNEAASGQYTVNGYLPVAPLAADPHPPGSLFSDQYQAYLVVQKNGAFIPYDDWSVPKVGNPFAANLQEIMAGKTSAQDGMTALQNSRVSFFAQLGVR